MNKYKKRRAKRKAKRAAASNQKIARAREAALDEQERHAWQSATRTAQGRFVPRA